MRQAKQNMRNELENIYLRRILEGETHLFSFVVERYSRPVFALIVRIAPSKEDAEELTQDVLLKVFRKLHTFKGECSFSTWLFRIAYNSAVSATRKKKTVFPPIDESLLERAADSSVNDLLEKEDDEKLLRHLEVAVSRLNTEERALISLFYYQEMPISEIAGVLELTIENVKVKLHRTRKKLYILINQMANESR